jgi:hypothetical protein
MMRLVTALSFTCLALLGTAGCSNDPALVAGTPQTVTLKYDGADLAETTQRASQYCSTFGKVARMQSTARQGNDNVAVFACI